MREVTRQYVCKACGRTDTVTYQGRAPKWRQCRACLGKMIWAEPDEEARRVRERRANGGNDA